MKKLLSWFKKLSIQQRAGLSIGAAVAVLLLLMIAVQLVQPPARSVNTYCKVYQSEKTRLATLPGNTWPSAVFDDSVSDAGQFVTSFNRLDKVAPPEIDPDVKTLAKSYKAVDDSPGQAFGVALGAMGAEDSVKTWTDSHCASTGNSSSSNSSMPMSQHMQGVSQ